MLASVYALPSLTFAQQPTATIIDMHGDVVVSIQGGEPATAAVGTVLQQEDRIQTSAGAHVVLQFSDGTDAELGENTNITMLELTEVPETGARKSRLKLWWGAIRTAIAPDHQKEGSSFDVETPNALVGVKFSQPDSEFIYDPNTEETIAIAHRFDLVLTSLLTGETVLILQGSSGIVNKDGIKKVNQIIERPPGTIQPPDVQPIQAPPQAPSVGPSGLSAKTLATIGLGTAATAGVVVAMAANSGQDESSSDFSGIFTLSRPLNSGGTQTITLHLTQSGTSISGSRSETIDIGCCIATGSGTVAGTAAGDTATLTVTRGAGGCSCSAKLSVSQGFQRQAANDVTVITGNGQVVGVSWNQEVSTGTATLLDNGNILHYGGADYAR